MPETAVNQDGFTARSENDVRPARELRRMCSKGESEGPNHFVNQDLGSRILPADTGHASTALLSR
jgi:hypothetical protein